MKKTKFFALAGLITLAVVSVFGTKPTRKFAGSTVHSLHAGTTDLFSSSSASANLTTSGSGDTAFFKTAGASSGVTLKTNGGTKIQFQ